MQKELEEACRDTRGLSPEDAKDSCAPIPQTKLPTKAMISFVSILENV